MEEVKNISTTQETTETKNNKKSFKNLSLLAKNSLIAVILIAITVAILSVWSALKPDNKKDEHNLFKVEMIRELTTLECRYHTVAVYDKEGGLLGKGEQYVWFEYDVIVDVGFDFDKVKIEEDKVESKVRIYLPSVDILSVRVDKETISKPVCDLGLFTDITPSEENQIINSGVEKLKNDAKTREVVLYAYDSAKRIFEQYVDNLNKLTGENYTVEWIESTEDIQETEDKQN